MDVAQSGVLGDTPRLGRLRRRVTRLVRWWARCLAPARARALEQWARARVPAWAWARAPALAGVGTAAVILGAGGGVERGGLTAGRCVDVAQSGVLGDTPRLGRLRRRVTRLVRWRARCLVRCRARWQARSRARAQAQARWQGRSRAQARAEVWSVEESSADRPVGLGPELDPNSTRGGNQDSGAGEGRLEFCT